MFFWCSFYSVVVLFQPLSSGLHDKLWWVRERATKLVPTRPDVKQWLKWVFPYFSLKVFFSSDESLYLCTCERSLLFRASAVWRHFTWFSLAGFRRTNPGLMVLASNWCFVVLPHNIITHTHTHCIGARPSPSARVLCVKLAKRKYKWLLALSCFRWHCCCADDGGTWCGHLQLILRENTRG